MNCQFAILHAAESQASKVEAEVKVEAYRACTLTGNSELFLACCSIGKMNSTLNNEIPIAIMSAAESQRARLRLRLRLRHTGRVRSQGTASCS
jgi:hypothetical protein